MKKIELPLFKIELLRETRQISDALHLFLHLKLTY